MLANNLFEFLYYRFVILLQMRLDTFLTAFNAARKIMDTAAAFVTEGIQRTVAEQTVEIFRIFNFVAGEILTFPVLKKLVAVHNLNP